MRGLLSWLAGVVALVGLLAAVPLLWVSSHVADEDGYVSFSSTLATDPELQGAFAAYLSDELASRGVLPETLEETATTALTAVATRTSSQDGFVEAWEETQRGFHREAFGDPPPKVLAVDVGPLAAFVARGAGDRVGLSLTVPDDLVVPVVSDASDRRQVERIEDTTSQGALAAVVALVGAVVCVGLARSRAKAVAGLGLGTVVVAGLLWVTTGPATQQVLDHTSAPSEFARTLQKMLVDRAADSLSGWLVVAAVAGAVLAAMGLVARAAGR